MKPEFNFVLSYVLNRMRQVDFPLVHGRIVLMLKLVRDRPSRD